MTGDSVSVGFPGASRAWMLSLAVVAAVHGGILAALIIRPPLPPLRFIDAPAAVLIDLAPAPAQTAALPKPVEPDRIEPPPPAVQSEVVLPKPKPVPKPRPVQRTEPPKPVEETRPAPALAEESRVAAPQARPAAPSNPSAISAWQQSLTAHLERHKRYPATAVSRRQEGTAHIRFTMDRAGRVLAAVLEHGSGVERLDRESLDLLARAEPLPTPPADVQGDRIELVVPIQFSLKR